MICRDTVLRVIDEHIESFFGQDRLKYICNYSVFLEEFAMSICEAVALEEMGRAQTQPTTNQGQNGTAGKPQVGECTTSAIGKTL